MVTYVNEYGLSPLARGNPAGHAATSLPQRPIPARTGQPGVRPCLHPPTWAYPRSHGATRGRHCSWMGGVGLSPLARGNQVETKLLADGSGPIPARTGQPNPWPPAQQPFWAYPRSHGATLIWPSFSEGTSGLSPLARGNPYLLGWWQVFAGPIPARTGQP